ncbi:hypothetical protein Enr13x_14360 [Stieleria neptunia]|uniref:DUF3592 domain-containing protein n=1 Tax=Stieleria neptunia TaxID=2527979 RepID=A0A518HL80_9BACT|nr:DUF3592 domain-containing protein [Stieleria neptunia]QDV41593.1 hypothetical protein Enr13x_14360 [Stieleria neptunia]
MPIPTGLLSVLLALGVLYGPLLIALPDLVYAERAGVSATVWSLVRLRLLGWPVWRLIGIAREVQSRGYVCDLSLVRRCYRPKIADQEWLEKCLEELVGSGAQPNQRRVKRRLRDAAGCRRLRNQAGAFFSILLLLAVFLFVFLFFRGRSLIVDWVLPPPNWQQTDGRLIGSSSGRSGIDSYTIAYEVSGDSYQATCYPAGNQLDLGADGGVSVEYDSAYPWRARIVGTAEVQRLAWGLAIFPFAALLVLVPMICKATAHLVAVFFVGVTRGDWGAEAAAA